MVLEAAWIFAHDYGESPDMYGNDEASFRQVVKYSQRTCQAGPDHWHQEQITCRKTNGATCISRNEEQALHHRHHGM